MACLNELWAVAGMSVDGLSKTVGIRMDLIAGGGKWVMRKPPLFVLAGPYADGVPQQDFPVKVASRSGQRSVTEKEVRP